MYKANILPVVLRGCETCSRTLIEKRRLKVFENRVLRRIFGGWRRLHNGELRNFYVSPNFIRVNLWKLRYGLLDRCQFPARKMMVIFIFASASIRALEPTQPPIQ